MHDYVSSKPAAQRRASQPYSHDTSTHPASQQNSAGRTDSVLVAGGQPRPVPVKELVGGQRIKGVLAEAGPGQAPHHAQRQRAQPHVVAAQQDAHGEVDAGDGVASVLQASNTIGQTSHSHAAWELGGNIP